MVGKSDGRISGKHSLECAGALGSEGEQMVGVITLRVVITEAVQRNKDDVVFRKLRRRIRAVINGDNSGDGLPVRQSREATDREYCVENADRKSSHEMAHT
jgi:predicted butyrate kinase (DUF1464 family)